METAVLHAYGLEFLVLGLSYLLGSIPTALIVSRRIAGIDIRLVGDGNMGARNTMRVLGFWPGVAVAIIDVLKGMTAVWVAKQCGLATGWLLAAAWAAVLGHDFPMYAGGRGGQGLATTIGTLMVLMPLETCIALVVYGALYLLTRNSDVGASVGLGVLVILAVWEGRSWMLVGHVVAMLLAIPAKKVLDQRRRTRMYA